MDKGILNYVGHSIYKRTSRGYKRYVVFRIRCNLHKDYIDDILDFFNATELRRKMLRGTPFFVEQVTRSFFYLDSTLAERVDLIKTHVLILEEIFTPELLEKIYACGNSYINIWQDSYYDKPLTLDLHFDGGQRKEGCLSMMLRYEDAKLYQIIFWLARDADGSTSIYIGAMQGLKNGREIIKGLTKAFFGYRTKNLIFYGLRCLAGCMGAKRICAVTNKGYYAMNHIRSDRKLKTDFAEFWEECGGLHDADKRFYVIPVAERRKSMEELKPSKRAQHRRRFEKMDEIAASIEKTLAEYKK
ncbi:MAG: VirK/YbjX family protein [Phascolarctobacterium sp.]|nr:VirK/YbjX family protein [Phascolarctobacterium sp.]